VTLAGPFVDHRPFLVSLAYRMLGSEAEDAVQEAFLRAQDTPAESLRSPRAFLATVVTRICLDQLKSAHARRETYDGPWLPEPVRTGGPGPLAGERAASGEPLDTESLSLAFLVVLESLSPLERAVFLLHEVFDYTHAEVAEIVQREEAAVRQLLHRAKAHVRERRPRFAPSREAHGRLLQAFATACWQGDLAGLERTLAADATAYSDGGGRVSAARKPVRGAPAIARFLTGVTRKEGAHQFVYSVEDVNGWPAIVWRKDGVAHGVLTIETDGELIHAVRMVLNPEKLVRI
jgi:RNA polymerase sigma-70 factor (ECF subfamily)